MAFQNRKQRLEGFEREAEALAVYQLDLLAQLERQLRAVHHTMRHIEKLRSVKHRIGTELSDNERGDELVTLSREIAELEIHFEAEHQCCTEMQVTIANMQNRLAGLQRRTSPRPTSEAQAEMTSDDAS